jgi:hypothetical protein
MSVAGDIIESGRFRLHRRDRMPLADGLKLDLGARANEVAAEACSGRGRAGTRAAT